jgi:hypothetical protein
MVRLVLGLVKGAVIGCALGFGAYQLGFVGAWGYVVSGIIGFAVGLFVGRPIWSHLIDRESTIWTAILKGIFGFGVGAGLFALVRHVAGDPVVAFGLPELSGPVSMLPHVVGGAIGALYGAWVEVDDAPAAKKTA